MTNKKPAVDDGTITLTLKVDKAEVSKAYQQVLVQAAKGVELKGFRKGKAPLNLVEKSLDKTKLYSRVLEVVLPPAYTEAIKAGKHQPLLEPRVTPVKMDEQSDWEFKAETAIEPKVVLGDYRKYVKQALIAAAKTQKPSQSEKDKKSDDWKLQAAFDALLKNAECHVSHLLIEHEAHTAIHRLEEQLSSLKLKLDDYLKSIKKSPEDFHQEYHQTAENNLRLEFILKSIIEVEKPEIPESELAKSNSPKGQENYVRYLLQKQKVLDMLVQL